jgi:hypothetical protein
MTQTLREEAQDRLIELIRYRARYLGWAVAIHGSRERDLDLIAVPWSADAASVEDLLLHICDGDGAYFLLVEGPAERQPHGRLGYVLHGAGASCEVKYIDLSVLSPVPEGGAALVVEVAEPIEGHPTASERASFGRSFSSNRGMILDPVVDIPHHRPRVRSRFDPWLGKIHHVNGPT